MYKILQYDDRIDEESISLFKPLKQQNLYYASLFSDVEIIQMTSNGFSNIPPWWQKVFLVAEILKTCKAVMWVDSDAAIVSKDHPSSLLHKGKHFVMSPNPNLLGPLSSFFTSPFCAGVWLVKNSPEGNLIMDVWKSAYNEKLWSKGSNNMWIHNKGLYGGIAYEQGCFQTNILNNKELNKWVDKKQYELLNYLPPPRNNKNSGNICKTQVFAVHYWANNKFRILDDWK